MLWTSRCETASRGGSKQQVAIRVSRSYIGDSVDSLQEALEKLGICRGTILAPEDFAELRRGAGDSTPELAGWAFSVPVGGPIGMALRREGSGGLFVGLLQTPSGLALLCATLQVGRVQVRTVVDSADSRAQELLRWS